MVAVATKGEIKNRTAPRCSAYSSFDRVDRCETYPLQYPAVFDVPDRKNTRFSRYFGELEGSEGNAKLDPGNISLG